MLHCFLECYMSNAIVLSVEERLLVRKGLQSLEASMKRSARSALNSDVAAIYERNAAQVAALVAKFA
ncbi:hypothetical protein [Microviridae sp.]|nr:hypothetical protein [Microviridae sp.]